MSRIVCLVSLIPSLFFSRGFAGEFSLDHAKTGIQTIRVAADFTSMPWYGYDEKTGQKVGFEYDFANEIFSNMQPPRKVKMVLTAWEKIGDAVLKGRADVGMNGFFLPPEKERVNDKFLWSDCYYKTSLSIMYLKKNGAPKAIDDLKKRRVTIFTDDAAIAVMKVAGIKKYKTSTFDSKFVEFVSKGITDYAILDKVAAHYMTKNDSAVAVENSLLSELSGSCYAMFVSKKNAALLESINRFGIPALNKRSQEILSKYGISE